MAVIETWLRQDLVSLVSVQNLSGHIFAQDNQGNRIGVEVTKNGVPVELSGTCTGYVIRSDGKTVVMYGEISGNKASILLPAACYAVVGNVNIVLKVGETTLLACTGYVYRTTTDTIVDPGTVVPNITELLDMIDDCEEATIEANNAAEVANAAAESILGLSPYKPAEGGSIVSFYDGGDDLVLRQLKFDVDPVQDLHGESSPYPGGGGVNLINFSDVTDGSLTNLYYGTYDTGYTLVADQQYTLSMDIASSVIPWNISVGVGDTGYKADLQSKNNNSNGRVYITFTPTAENLQTYSTLFIRVPRYSSQTTCTYTIKNVTLLKGTDTAYHPYSNICPITGHTEANVYRTGKNLCKRVIQGFPYTSNQTIYIDNDTESAVFYAISGQTYCRSASVAFNRNMLAHVATSEITTGMPYTDIVNQSSAAGTTWTATWTGWTVWYCSASKNTSMESSLQVEIGSTASTYTPYVGTTYPITFPTEAGTVYSGVIDLKARTLTVDRATDVIDEDSAIAVQETASAYVMFRATIDTAVKGLVSYDNTLSKCLCNRLRVYKNNGAYMIRHANANGTKYVYIGLPSDISTVEQCKTWLESNPLQYTHPIEPIVYSLSDVEQVKTLLGENHFWVDTGDITELDYPVDIKTYVDEAVSNVERAGNEQIAYVEDTTTATRDYQAGDLFILNDILYKATALIVTGDTIYPGINASETTVEEIIDDLVEEIDGTITDRIEDVEEELANLIDDDAGTGDTDVVWSADKSSKELNDISNSIPAASNLYDYKEAEPGAIVTFNDDVADNIGSMILSVDPIQDLHGQSNPYPAGGGANKFDGLWNGASSGFNYATNYIPVTAGESYFVKTPNIATDFAYIDWCDAEKTVLSDTYVRNGTATAPTGASYARLRVWYTLDTTDISFNYPATDTAYHPYSNLCPITGHTGANVYRTGKNMIDFPDISAPSTANTGLTFDYVLPTGDYVLSFDVVGAARSVTSVTTVLWVRYAGGTTYGFDTSEIKRVSDDQTMQNGTWPLTGRYYVKVTNKAIDRIVFAWRSDTYMTLTAGAVRNIMLESGTSATDYAAPNCQTYPISWQTAAGTVYGGTVDPPTGKLVDFMGAKYIIDGSQTFGNVTNKVDSGGNAYTTARFVLSQNAPNLSSGYVNAVCSQASVLHVYYAWQNQDIPAAGKFSVNNNNMSVSVPGTFADSAALKAYFAANPWEVVYEKATKAEYTMTDLPTITTLIGENNIWADTGDIQQLLYPMRLGYTKSESDTKLKNLEDTKASVIFCDASGDIATFSDGADCMSLSECVVSVDPVQDLHGYANPWPAGGGIQLIPYPGYESTPITKNGIAITDIGNGRIHIQGTATGQVYFNFYGSPSTPIPAWVKPDTQYTLRPITVASKYFVQFILYGSPTYAATGSTFTTPSDLSGYTGFAIVLGVYNGAEVNTDVSPMLEYGATAHDFAPYSNICPITGHTRTQIYRTGKNLYGFGVPPVFGTSVHIESLLKIGKKYTVSAKRKDQANGSYLYIYKAKNYAMDSATNIGYILAGTNNRPPVTFTVEAGYYYTLWFGNGFQNITDIQIECGSSGTDYEPYTGQIYPVSFGSAGTVYGGVVDLEAQMLTVDRVSVDLGSLSWEYTSSAFCSTTAVTGIVAPATQWGQPQAICERYAPSADAELSDYHFAIGPASYSYARKIRIKDPAYSGDADAFKAAVTGTKIVCKLTTPQTYQLDPVQITTLLGENNIWADTGAVAVTYPADTKLYIQQLTKPTEDDMTANTAITSGKFFMVGNRLFLATAAIAVGATIIPGTNCTELSLADALNNINA